MYLLRSTASSFLLRTTVRPGSPTVPAAEEEAPLDLLLEALKDCLLQPSRGDAKSAAQHEA